MSIRVSQGESKDVLRLGVEGYRQKGILKIKNSEMGYHCRNSREEYLSGRNYRMEGHQHRINEPEVMNHKSH